MEKDIIYRIEKQIKTTYKFSKLKLILFSIISIIYAFFWTIKYKTHLKLKYKLRLAIHTALVLEDSFTLERMKVFFSSISIVRIIDDLYDEKNFSDDFLNDLKKTVLYNKQTNITTAQRLSRIFNDILNRIQNLSNKNNWSRKKDLILKEFDILIDGFGKERSWSRDKRINYTTYIQVSYHTIGLPYIMRILFSLDPLNKDNLKKFKKYLNYEFILSESIRLTNDIVGYTREYKQNKLNAVDILREQKNNHLDILLNNIKKISNEPIDKSDTYLYIATRITLLGIIQYFKARKIYSS